MILEDVSEIQNRLAGLPEAEWIRAIKEDFCEKGSYRVEDLIRLLGEPTEGVSAGEDLDGVMRQAFMLDEEKP